MSTSLTRTLSKPLSAMLATLALSVTAAPAFADEAAAASRQQVREELAMWKTTNMMSQSGEISEPPAVLEAREAFYSLQHDVIEEENRVAWQQWQLAQQEQPMAVVLVFEAE